MDIHFIIPVYKPDKAKLRTLCETLRDYPVICVENDNKIRKSDWKRLTYVHNSVNYGYGGGVNRGITRALAEGADWVTILNQDLRIDPKSLKNLVNDLENAVPGIRGPFGGTFDPKRWTTIVDEKSHEVLPRVDYISGSCLSIHRKVIESVGLLYEPYFMYYEDADYSVRARNKGFPITAISPVGIVHYHTPVVGKGSFTHEYYLARNHMLFVRRQAPFTVKLHEYIRMLKTLWVHNKNKNKGALTGMKDFLIRRFGKYWGKV